MKQNYLSSILIQYQIMLKLVPSLVRKMFAPCLLKNIPKYYCAQFTIDPYIEHYAELTMRQHRRLHLNRSVLNQNKDVVYAELRQPQDGMISLKQKGKCPGVIQVFGGKIEDQIDIVLDGKKMRKLTKSELFPLTPVYVRVEGKEYRCVFYRKDYHSDGFIQKVYLKQYVPGKPNKLTVPIQITHITENAYFMRNGDFNIKMFQIDLICFNEEYPTRLYVDSSYCFPDRPYRVGDLANILPPGILISPKHNMNDKIVIMEEEENLSEAEREEKIAEKINSVKAQSDLEKTKTGASSANAAGGTAADASKDKAATGGAATTAAKTGGAATGKSAGESGGKKK